MLLSCAADSRQEKKSMLDEQIARRYTAAWADRVGASLKDLHQGENGSFFGQLGSLGFEYLPKQEILAVRAYILPRSRTLTSRADLLPWLNSIAATDPESVSHGIFEVCPAPWEPDKEPSLFLRIDIRDGREPESAVMSRFSKLREDGLIWRRTKLVQALDALEKTRRREQHPQKP